jgi:leucyl aminopeptidase
MSSSAQTDPLIEDMVETVSKERLTGYIQTLQDFQTRYTYTQGNTDAGNWLHDFFVGLGLEVERHEFTWSSHTEENIIARIPGSLYPDEIVAISGHFDSTSEDPYNLAPGADDDASGVAAVLEAAMILKDFQFERTIEFWCFNAEEQGRQGSQAIAGDYYAAGQNIVAVLNNDMIGYWPTGWQRDLDVAYEPVSEWLADYVISISNEYVGIPIEKHPSGSCRDDHVSFTNLGYSAITNMDCWESHNWGGETTPHYHRTTDTIETLNMDCTTEAVQVNIACVADLAGPLTLTADSYQISASAGGTIVMKITAGPTHRFRSYAVCGSVSGTEPGLPLPGGPVLPLNRDWFFDLVLDNLNTSIFTNFLGDLDADGKATAQLVVPPGVLEYIEESNFYFAYPLLNPLDFASTPIRIVVVP